ncbi:MAG: hypothetical protein M3178_10695, partial [Pseudomonadota bacterium]|nr:hypothetical protein [Pseudomonadota bacterium]
MPIFDRAFWIALAFAMIFPARKREKGGPAKFYAGNKIYPGDKRHGRPRIIGNEFGLLSPSNRRRQP